MTIQKFIRWGSILTLMLGVSACATARKESFSESFFTYQNDAGKKYFSFILKLDGMNGMSEHNPFEAPQGRSVQTGNGKERRERKEDPIAMPEDPLDALVSLKFRMEEIAHSKLAERLESTHYCPDKVEFEEEEYEKFHYKIKGFCSE